MALTPRQVRRRITDHMLAELEGWSESREGYRRFGRDSRAIAHKAFVVAVPSTTVMKLDKQRTEATVTSDVRVKWSRSHKTLDQSAGYDLGLDAEANELVPAALSVPTDPDLSIRLVSMSRTEEGTEWMVGEIVLVVTHRYLLV